MRIAYVIIDCNRREGTARAVAEVAERMASTYGHEVHLFSRTVADIDLNLIRWHRVPGPRRPEAAHFATFFALVGPKLRRERFDIVHSAGCNTTQADIYTVQNVQPAKRRVLSRVAQAERVSMPRRFTRWLHLAITSAAERRVYPASNVAGLRGLKRGPLLLPVSKGTERELREHYDIAANSVRVIPNATDTSVFQPLSPNHRSAWRQSSGIKTSDFLCIFSGGEWARKGLELAIRALHLIGRSDVKLFVAGDDPDRERYRRLTSNLGLSGRVIFGGLREDIATALGAADLFLFPSYYEAFSLATLEAAACALPVVASRINGTEDFIKPGINGEFIEHDPVQIASVLRSLTSNVGHCRVLGAAARCSVEANYTWDRVAEMTKEAYLSYAHTNG
jgi:glycosyltransferase involved in cell wall biosynthesis